MDVLIPAQHAAQEMTLPFSTPSGHRGVCVGFAVFGEDSISLLSNRMQCAVDSRLLVTGQTQIQIHSHQHTHKAFRGGQGFSFLSVFVVRFQMTSTTLSVPHSLQTHHIGRQQNF